MELIAPIGADGPQVPMWHKMKEVNSTTIALTAFDPLQKIQVGYELTSMGLLTHKVSKIHERRDHKGQPNDPSHKKDAFVMFSATKIGGTDGKTA